MKIHLLVLLAILSSISFSNEFEDILSDIATTKIASFTQQPIVIDSIKKQNIAHANLSESDIIKLDKQWRSEIGASSSPLIDEVLGNSLSAALSAIQAESDGLYTEIFVMDNKGLNVGQSDVTSDYWQGDEAKWQDTFLKGPNAVHISDVEEDESTQTFQSQVSISIADPSTGETIGSVTVGINIDKL